MVTRIALPLIALIAIVTSTRGQARACSPKAEGWYTRDVFPANGTIGIPLNPRIAVQYDFLERPGSRSGEEIALGADLQLVGSDGQVIPVVVTTVAAGGNGIVDTAFLSPREPLTPGSTYELQDRRGTLPCELKRDGCLLGPTTTFARFTTGSSVDDQPPEFAGLSAVSRRNDISCDGGGACCGSYLWKAYGFTWAAAHDAVSGQNVRYNVYEEDIGTLVRGLLDQTEVEMYASCEGSFANPLSRSSAEYLVRAVDWAGNEDRNAASRRIEAPCPDSGILGCAVSTPPPEGGSSWWGLAALALVLVRTRRFSRRPPAG